MEGWPLHITRIGDAFREPPNDGHNFKGARTTEPATRALDEETDMDPLEGLRAALAYVRGLEPRVEAP